MSTKLFPLIDNGFMFECHFGDPQQRLLPYRLGDIIESPLANGLCGRGDLRSPCNHNDRAVDKLLPDDFQQAKTTLASEMDV